MGNLDYCCSTSRTNIESCLQPRLASNLPAPLLISCPDCGQCFPSVEHSSSDTTVQIPPPPANTSDTQSSSLVPSFVKGFWSTLVRPFQSKKQIQIQCDCPDCQIQGQHQGFAYMSPGGGRGKGNRDDRYPDAGYQSQSPPSRLCSQSPISTLTQLHGHHKHRDGHWHDQSHHEGTRVETGTSYFCNGQGHRHSHNHHYHNHHCHRAGASTSPPTQFYNPLYRDDYSNSDRLGLNPFLGPRKRKLEEIEKWISQLPDHSPDPPDSLLSDDLSCDCRSGAKRFKDQIVAGFVADTMRNMQRLQEKVNEIKPIVETLPARIEQSTESQSEIDTALLTCIKNQEELRNKILEVQVSTDTERVTKLTEQLNEVQNTVDLAEKKILADSILTTSLSFMHKFQYV